MREIGELNKAWKEAYSIENMEGHGAAGRSTEYIGAVEKGDKVFLLYRDTDGAYWYKKQTYTGEEFLSEYESIFGKKEVKRYGRKKCS